MDALIQNASQYPIPLNHKNIFASGLPGGCRCSQARGPAADND
jgi:hypothetical protein